MLHDGAPLVATPAEAVSWCPQELRNRPHWTLIAALCEGRLTTSRFTHSHESSNGPTARHYEWAVTPLATRRRARESPNETASRLAPQEDQYGWSVRQLCASATSRTAVSGGLQRSHVPERRLGVSPAKPPFPLNHAICPRRESNARTRFRKPMLYPLSYGGGLSCSQGLSAQGRAGLFLP